MGWGDWSDVWNFKSTAGFIDLTFPNGGETWDTDTSLVIYWDFNTTDNVNIDLYKNDVFSRTVVDSFYSVTGGYKWTLSDSLASGTDYKIKISSIDGSLEDMSESNFTIIYNPTDVGRTDELVTDFRLEQNYPNPFNPSTTIRYSLPLQSQVTVKIYNSIGENISEIVNLTQSAGSYQANWNAGNVASGIYFYSIEAIPTDGSEVFRSVKKMILLK
jgi:hypothetical protein